MSTTLTQASTQWRSRPADERFCSLIDLNNHLQDVRRNSAEKVVSSRRLTVEPTGDSAHQGLHLVGPSGSSIEMTNWSFGQLASRVGAPAGYLRELPAPLAADNLNYGLQVSSDIQNIGVLLSRTEGPPVLRAVTGPSYGRVWNATISQALLNRFGDGLTGDFRIPGEFGQAVEVSKDNTTLYASDRDMFVFLADENHRITIPNRRDGKSGDLARGFFVWNSETGASTFGIATFLFDYVCANRIVWGAAEYKEIRIRHTASAPDRWIEQVAPALTAYANSSTTLVAHSIENAQAQKIDRVDEFLRKRFSAKVSTAIQTAHATDELRPIETLWDVATGITAYAREIPFQDERIKLEREAGRILDMA